MTHEEILQLLYDETLVGNAPGRQATASTTASTQGSSPSGCSTTR